MIQMCWCSWHGICCVHGIASSVHGRIAVWWWYRAWHWSVCDLSFFTSAMWYVWLIVFGVHRFTLIRVWDVNGFTLLYIDNCVCAWRWRVSISVHDFPVSFKIQIAVCACYWGCTTLNTAEGLNNVQLCIILQQNTLVYAVPEFLIWNSWQGCVLHYIVLC